MFEEFMDAEMHAVKASPEVKLTEENYYSTEANNAYMSVSQFKNFAGCGHAIEGCEFTALAKLRGEYKEEPNTAMMIGSYVDRHFEGTLDSFKLEHPEIFKKDGSLKAEYEKANAMIARAERDDLFMKYMSGDKQVIMTGELFGAKWKIKMDSYIDGKAIVDLKCMGSITKLEWVRGLGYTPFPLYWGYDIQGAIYQEVVRQNTGKTLPFYIAGISKEACPDIGLIWIPDSYLQDALRNVEAKMPRILDLINGRATPERCEKCDYCRTTKVLTEPSSIADMFVQSEIILTGED